MNVLWHVLLLQGKQLRDQFKTDLLFGVLSAMHNDCKEVEFIS